MEVKKYLIVVLLLALALTGCSETSEQPVEAPQLTEDEQIVYNHIKTHIHEIEALVDKISIAVQHDDMEDIIIGLSDCVNNYTDLRDEWSDIPWAQGNVTKLELAYDDAGTGLRDILYISVQLTLGETVSNEEMEQAVTDLYDAIQNVYIELREAT